MAASSQLLKRPIRALCFHGWRTNADLMRFQTSQLERAFEPNEISLRHLNGPILSETAADPSLEKLVKGPYYEWWNATESHPEGDITRYKYNGLVDAIHSSLDVIQNEGPFDVLIGFSQGGILATLLTTISENPSLLSQPPFNTTISPSSSTTPNATTAFTHQIETYFETNKFKCTVVVGSMKPRDETLDFIFNPSSNKKEKSQNLFSVNNGLKTPSIHIYGLTDKMLPLSKELAYWWRGDSYELTEEELVAKQQVLDAIAAGTRRHLDAEREKKMKAAQEIKSINETTEATSESSSINGEQEPVTSNSNTTSNIINAAEESNSTSEESARRVADAEAGPSFRESSPYTSSHSSSSSNDKDEDKKPVIPTPPLNPTFFEKQHVSELSHRGGHKFPSGKESKAQYAFVRDQIKKYCEVNGVTARRYPRDI